MKTKSQPNRLGMYDDVRQILDSALASGGGTLTLSTRGQAIHWRQRAYKFRKLYAQTLASDDSFSMSPYDRLSMPNPPDEGEPGANIVVIKVREIVGTFTPNREPYAPVDVPVVGDELFGAAQEIAKRIKGGEL